MEYHVSHNNGTIQFELYGRFTFNDNQHFHDILKQVQKLDNRISTVCLHFPGVDFIDSAGLGMLLLLRDECLARKLTLRLSSAQGQVKRMFDLSRFETLFEMEQ